MNNKWLTSDTHYGHTNIVEGVSQWIDKGVCRKFKTLEEHNEELIAGINKYVDHDDTLYHMGDWSFGGFQNIWEFYKRINCNNIHLILGNHDHHIANNKHLGPFEGYAQDLFKSVSRVLYKTMGGEDFVLCHYAMRTWDKAHKGSIMLYGHSHGSLPDYKTPDSKDAYKTMDVGIDVAYQMFGEYRPFHLDEILKIMKNRVNLSVDHH